MANNKIGRPKKGATEKRQSDAQELLLKGFKDHEIVAEMAAIYPNYGVEQLNRDKELISAAYFKAVTENKYMLAKQAEHIMRHLDQLDMIKKRLWEIDSQAQDKDDIRGQLDALKTLITESEHESKILRLIDTSHKIIKNYIHVDKLNVIMNRLTDVVREFVPTDKQTYAFQRIKELGNVLDTECSEVIDEIENDDNKKKNN